MDYIHNSIFTRWITGIIQNRKAVTGVGIIFVFIFLAVFGPFITQDPTAFLSRPLSPPSWEHWLGTNGQGQDVLAQTISGARQTLLVGFTTGIMVVLIGALIGGISGYYGGRIDDILSLLINVFLVMPGLPLMLYPLW